MKGRRWTEEEDQLLRETVLRSISSGGTQLDAFEEVGSRLGRTSGACGFRWNAVLRQKDPRSYSEAKKKRVYQQLQKKRGNQVTSFSQVLTSLKQAEKGWKRLHDEVHSLKQKVMEKEQRLNQLQDENKRLTEEKNSYEWYQREVKEKYQDLLHILKHLQEELPTGQIADIHSERKSGVHADTERNSSS